MRKRNKLVDLCVFAVVVAAWAVIIHANQGCGTSDVAAPDRDPLMQEYVASKGAYPYIDAIFQQWGNDGGPFFDAFIAACQRKHNWEQNAGMKYGDGCGGGNFPPLLVQAMLLSKLDPSKPQVSNYQTVDCDYVLIDEWTFDSLMIMERHSYNNLVPIEPDGCTELGYTEPQWCEGTYNSPLPYALSWVNRIAYYDTIEWELEYDGWDAWRYTIDEEWVVEPGYWNGYVFVEFHDGEDHIIYGAQTLTPWE